MIFIETRVGCFVNTDHVIKIECRGLDIAFVTARDTEFICFADEQACQAGFERIKKLISKQIVTVSQI